MARATFTFIATPLWTLMDVDHMAAYEGVGDLRFRFIPMLPGIGTRWIHTCMGGLGKRWWQRLYRFCRHGRISIAGSRTSNHVTFRYRHCRPFWCYQTKEDEKIIILLDRAYNPWWRYSPSGAFLISYSPIPLPANISWFKVRHSLLDLITAHAVHGIVSNYLIRR